MKHVISCPICETENNFISFLDTLDYSSSKEKFLIKECKSCSHRFTSPQPDEKEIGKYYAFEEYISHTNTKKGFINNAYHQIRKHTTREKINLCKKFAPKGTKLLDYGCGTGFFAGSATKVFKVSAYEKDENAAEIAAKNPEINMISSLEDLSKNGNYSIITLWHVLEHVHKLKWTLKQLTSSLEPEGRIIIALPNCSSFDAQAYGKYWAAYDVPRHLYHFRRKDLKELLSQFGMNLEEEYPMWFDSFYVSMLSEKYRNGNMLSGIINGAISNLKGLKTKEYSSIIYVFKKRA